MYKYVIADKKVVCFDLDGTIVDTEPYFVLAFSKVLGELNPEVFFSEIYGAAGEPMIRKWNRAITEGYVKQKIRAEELTHKTYQEFLTQLKELPLDTREGFLQLIFKLKEEKGLKIALTTNTIKDVATQVLAKLQIESVFDFMIFGDDISHPKPDPEIYQKTAKHFNVNPNEMVVFEDSILGATAANKAGASLVVVWDGQTSQKMFPPETLFFIDDFDNLDRNIEYTAQEQIENLKKRMELEAANKKKR